jgi:hypothetical protein
VHGRSAERTVRSAFAEGRGSSAPAPHLYGGPGVAQSPYKMASSDQVQRRPDTDSAEVERQQSIAKHAANAKAWWDSGRVCYIVKLGLGGTVAGLTEHSDLESEDVSGIVQQIEAIGWHLFHIGYVYQPRERSHALTTSNIMTGNIVGIHTFTREHQGLERLL